MIVRLGGQHGDARVNCLVDGACGETQVALAARQVLVPSKLPRAAIPAEDQPSAAATGGVPDRGELSYAQTVSWSVIVAPAAAGAE